MRITDLNLRIKFDGDKFSYVGGDVIRGTVSLTSDKDITLKSVTIGMKCGIRATYEHLQDGKRDPETEWTDLYDESRIVFPRHATNAMFTLAKGEHTYSFEHRLPAEPHAWTGGLDRYASGVFWFVYVTVDRDSRLHHNHVLKKFFEVPPRGWPSERDLKNVTRDIKALKAYIPRPKTGGFRDMLKTQTQGAGLIDVVLVVRAPREGILQHPWPCNIEVSFECKRPELFVVSEIRVILKRDLKCIIHNGRQYDTSIHSNTVYERYKPIPLVDFGLVQSKIMQTSVVGEPGMLEYDQLQTAYFIKVKCLIASREKPRHVEKLKSFSWGDRIAVLNRMCWPIGEAPPEAGPKQTERADSKGGAEKVHNELANSKSESP